ACAPPSEAWAIEQTWPADGQDATPDAPLMVLGRERDWSNFAFADRLTVEITRDGEPVEGALAPAPTSELALWWPSEPWQPGATYAVSLRVDNEYDYYEDTRDELALRFTVGEAPAPAASEPAMALAVEGWQRELTECVEEAPIGYCGDCLERQVVGHEDRLRVRGTATAPAAGATWQVRVKAAPSAEALVERGPSVARHFLGAAQVELIADLGRRADWPSDTVCVQAEQMDPQGRIAAGEVQCFDLEQAEDPEVPEGGGDAEQAALRQGCSATGGGPAAPLWLLLLLPAVRRRRR
ncbi:MAG: hypothetical protein KC613_21885, partial [Myxococcales bacterium]|nr:hypothetical protein [Myxococcales bacterium]